MLHFGIPAYRLPRDGPDEGDRPDRGMGVTIVLNHKVDDVLAEQEAGRFDAVFVAIGAQARQARRHPGARRRPRCSTR